jgi:hypothetical protein
MITHGQTETIAVSCQRAIGVGRAARQRIESDWLRSRARAWGGCIQHQLRTAAAVAVLAGADKAWVPVRPDGVARLPSSVFLQPDDRWLTGAVAWQAGLTQPARFVTAPVKGLRAESVQVDGVAADPADMVAATLRRLMETVASRLGGDPVSGVRLVVPAGWDHAGWPRCGRRRSGPVYRHPRWWRRRSRWPSTLPRAANRACGAAKSGHVLTEHDDFAVQDDIGQPCCRRENLGELAVAQTSPAGT